MRRDGFGRHYRGFVRRLGPTDFRRLSKTDQHVFSAWMATHGFNVKPASQGGDYIDSVDVHIPTDRVWPEGTPMTEGLDDCWLVVHTRLRPDGTRPTLQPDGTMHRSELMTVTVTRAMICRPPGCVRAVLDDQRPWDPPPTWSAAIDDLVSLERRLRSQTTCTDQV